MTAMAGSIDAAVGTAQAGLPHDPAATPSVPPSRHRKGEKKSGSGRKASSAVECEALEQLPNIGPALARDLRSIGVAHPRELAAHDGFALYRALCAKTGRRQDPCVLDTFLAATDFMRGAPAAPWWAYTARRKRQFEDV